MKRLIFCASALTAMLAMSSACNDDNELQEISKSDAAATTLQLTPEEISVLKTMDGQSPIISQDEAIGIAGNFLGKTSLSKSASEIKCEVITRQSPSISKSGSADTDTLMYILNYGDGDGYALVCADVRVPEQILAFSETGNLDVNRNNPGIEIFMSMAESYIDVNIAKIESMRDSLEDVLHEKFNGTPGQQGNHLSKRTLVYSHKYEYYQNHVHTILSQIDPLLRTYWSQRSPYNNYVPTYIDEDGKVQHCPAGCVAVATSQLMAYWQWPRIIKGLDMHWNSIVFDNHLMEKSAREMDMDYKIRVATLVSYVGEKINTNYKPAESGAYNKDAIIFLAQNGYTTYGETDYNVADVCQSITNNRPVIIGGFRKENGEKKGHSWILDGYIDEKVDHTYKYIWVATYQEDNSSTTTTYQVPQTTEYTVYSNYFHCNWGWDNIDNGYFSSNVFDTNRPYEISPSGTQVNPAFSNKTNNRYYQYNLKIGKNIHK